MNFWVYILWISLLLVFYNYFGYAMLVWLVNRFKKTKPLPDPEFFPTVSFIVAAYNEEDCIEKKILNSLEQDYPADRLEYIFIADGSTDRTLEILNRHPAVTTFYQPERMGKSAALNRAVAAAKNDILIFSDANTVLNRDACRNIARHYANPKTGGVAGEKKVISASGGKDEVGEGEGLYWKYESFLKKLDSDFYSVVGAAGELFSLRRELYEPVGQEVILDDFIISMKVVENGYRVVYEPDAYAMELPSFSIKDEKKRKIRIAAGGFQSMGMLPDALRFWKHFRLSFLYISHRVLRWTLSPVCLLLALIASAVLSFSTELLVYQLLFAAQLLFYGMALIEGIFGTGLKLLRLCYYFVFMNLSVVLGFLRYLRGKQPATWEKAKRMQAA